MIWQVCIGKVVVVDVNEGCFCIFLEVVEQQGVGDVVLLCYYDFCDYVVCCYLNFFVIC